MRERGIVPDYTMILIRISQLQRECFAKPLPQSCGLLPS